MRAGLALATPAAAHPGLPPEPRDPPGNALFPGQMAQHLVLMLVATPLPAVGAPLLAWHVPALYDLAARSGTAQTLEHTSFRGTGVLSWWAARPRAGR